jgi:hypothetical protein
MRCPGLSRLIRLTGYQGLILSIVIRYACSAGINGSQKRITREMLMYNRGCFKMPDNSKKIILDLCGGTGSWSKPYKKAGYQVIVITLPDYSVTNVVFYPDYMIFKHQTLLTHDLVISYESVYGILAAPPCTMFSFARANAIRKRNLKEGMITVEACLRIIWACQFSYCQQKHGYKTSLRFWSLENPNGFLKYFIGKPVFVFHPYEFGDMYTKQTYLWGNFDVPVKTNNIKPVDNIKFGVKTTALKSIADITFRDTKNRQMLRYITPPILQKHFLRLISNGC